MGVGIMVEFMSRWIFNTVLVTSVLGKALEHMLEWGLETNLILLLIEHERSNGPTLIGTGSSLSTNTNSGTANAEMVGRARDGMKGRRHCMEAVMRVGDNWSG